MKAINRVWITKNHTVIDTARDGGILNVSHGKRLSSFRLCLLHRSKLLWALSQRCSRGPYYATSSCCKAQFISRKIQKDSKIQHPFDQVSGFCFPGISHWNPPIFSSKKSVIFKAIKAQSEQKWGSLASLGVGGSWWWNWTNDGFMVLKNGEPFWVKRWRIWCMKFGLVIWWPHTTPVCLFCFARWLTKVYWFAWEFLFWRQQQ